MAENGFFNWLGESLGDAIRFVVDLLSSIFAGFGGAVHDFIEGLTGSLGMSPSLFGLIVLLIGLLLLYKGIRAFINHAIVGGLIWTLLGLIVLSWLIA
ncbi:hypothetical protein SAMN05661010_03162 [Modicisalibacter muralis]|uniref:Uncharacterized protein n=1 Tax=Modicisalibacter muralis TaxID=119000 RepID=A0A1G9PVP7_9GAMM|nr:hypothetical protein [Halomonas muralis]SDM02848.1 hypothetical protein SAMN05661010_03162 [Halomonas muralis]